MIDLEKEREAFEAWVIDISPQIQWQLHVKDDDGDYESLSMLWAFSTWKHKQKEITELRQKLARYENPDYVLVPRSPTRTMIGNAQRSDDGFLRHYQVSRVWSTMIEAVEKDNE